MQLFSLSAVLLKSVQRVRLMLALVVVAVCGLIASPALADKLHLKDGRVLEGVVEREAEGFVYFTITIGDIKHTELFTKDQIVKLERDDTNPAPDAKKDGKAADAAATSPTGKAPEAADQATPIDDSATRVCFISIEEEVGMLLNADAIERSIDLIRPEKPDVIVLVIDSGGGALIEVQPLSDLIHEELKKDFRVVGWIKSAISAASLTIFNCEEIYMMREGNVGGTVAFIPGAGGGGNKAIEGADLEQVLAAGEEISKRGNRNPLIMRAMQQFMVLSADIDENGQVIWYEGDQGKYLVNPDDRILTFNSIDAEKFGISKGTADTKAELVRLMGIKEWVEVGQKADEDQRAFRENVKKVQARIGTIQAEYTLAVGAASSAQNEKDRGRYVGRARSILGELRSLVRRAPSVERYMGLTKEFFEDREEELRKLLAGQRN